jgi:hypothetical protein
LHAPPPYNRAMGFRRRDEPTTVEDERVALQEQRAALEELKRELSERVRAVQERELELQHALADAGGPRPGAPTLPPAGVLAPVPVAADDDTDEIAREAVRREQALEAERRERALLDRERAVAARELELEQRAKEVAALPPPDPDAERLAQIEARLAELRGAEKLFVRTREEVAGRSEAVAARERLVAQRERELDDREDGKGKWASPELSEMEARLRRLETQQPGEQTLGFSGGLRKLEQGTRPQRGG